MLKAILLFIKTHAIATAITTTVVVGTAVATPIVVENHKLDEEVKEHLNMLVPSDYQIENDNQTSDTSDNMQESNNENINTDEPLTFKIVKTTTKTEGGGMVKDMQGNDAIEASVEGVLYSIVPSYDKDYSKWTKADKEAYKKALEELNRMAEEEYKAAAASEQQNMLNAIIEIEKIDASYSEYYTFDIGYSFGNGGMTFTSEQWRYNSYTKTYSAGNYLLYEEYGIIIDEEKYEITANEFRNIVYPKLLQKIETTKQERIKAYGTPVPSEAMDLFEQERQENLNKLNELYHLSD